MRHILVHPTNKSLVAYFTEKGDKMHIVARTDLSAFTDVEEDKVEARKFYRQLLDQKWKPSKTAEVSIKDIKSIRQAINSSALNRARKRNRYSFGHRSADLV